MQLHTTGGVDSNHAHLCPEDAGRHYSSTLELRQLCAHSQRMGLLGYSVRTAWKRGDALPSGCGAGLLARLNHVRPNQRGGLARAYWPRNILSRIRPIASDSRCAVLPSL